MCLCDMILVSAVVLYKAIHVIMACDGYNYANDNVIQIYAQLNFKFMRNYMQWRSQTFCDGRAHYCDKILAIVIYKFVHAFTKRCCLHETQSDYCKSTDCIAN